MTVERLKELTALPLLKCAVTGWGAGFYFKPNTAVKVDGNKPDLNEFRDSCALSVMTPTY